MSEARSEQISHSAKLQSLLWLKLRKLVFSVKWWHNYYLISTTYFQEQQSSICCSFLGYNLYCTRQKIWTLVREYWEITRLWKYKIMTTHTSKIKLHNCVLSPLESGKKYYILSYCWWSNKIYNMKFVVRLWKQSATDNLHGYSGSIPLAKRDTVAIVSSRYHMNTSTALHQEADTLAYRGQVVSWIPELSWTQLWWVGSSTYFYQNMNPWITVHFSSAPL